MASRSKKNKNKNRQIGKKKKPEKKPLIDPRYQNTFWTGVTIVILIIFFIVNNTGNPEGPGPYPPNYKKSEKIKPDTTINDKVDIKIKEEK